MTTEQPNALRLADALEGWHSNIGQSDREAAELRRLHAVNAGLVEALQAHHQWHLDYAEIDDRTGGYSSSILENETIAALAAANAAPQALSVAEQMKTDGFDLYFVKGLEPLITALNRAESKGYMPDSMIDEWSGFDYMRAFADKTGTP